MGPALLLKLTARWRYPLGGAFGHAFPLECFLCVCVCVRACIWLGFAGWHSAENMCPQLAVSLGK